MKYFITFISLMLLISCTPKQAVNESPLGYSFMPKYLNLDSVGPKIPSPAVLIDTTFKDFKSIPVRIGIHYFKNDQNKIDSIMLPRGILLSEYKAAYYVFYEAEYQRLKTQLFYSDYLSRQYYDKALAAEKLYQDEIVRLRKEAQRSWWEQNSIYLGFGLGLITAVITEWAVLHVNK